MKISISIPVLETARLRLREHCADDHARGFEIWSSPEVVRYVGIAPSNRQQAWVRVLNYRGHWAVMGFGYWAVEEKSSGRYIGDVGFSDFERDIVPSLEGLPELGWVKANFAHVLPEASRMVCMIAPDNAASLRVASKCGFTEYSRENFQGSVSILLERQFLKS